MYRENIENRESNRQADCPVPSIDSQAIRSARKCSVRVRPAPSSVCRRLKIEFRIVRALQHPYLSSCLLNSSFLLGRERMCCNSLLGRCSLRQGGNEGTFSDLHIAVRNRENIRQSRAADFLLLASTRQVRLRPCQFCIGPRTISSRTKLVVH